MTKLNKYLTNYKSLINWDFWLLFIIPSHHGRHPHPHPHPPRVSLYLKPNKLLYIRVQELWKWRIEAIDVHRWSGNRATGLFRLGPHLLRIYIYIFIKVRQDKNLDGSRTKTKISILDTV